MRHMHVGEHICVFLEELGVFLQEMRNVFGGKTGVGHGWESSLSTVGRSASISIWPANTETAAPLMTRRSPSQATVSVPPRALTRTGLSSRPRRSEEHTSELQSLMRISYAVFCLQNKKKT